jgi:uncharacterized membrane protein YgdD (TMEM256/DUF423 family)
MIAPFEMHKKLMVFAAFSAAIAISAGAFGAHGAASALAKSWLETGASYHLLHAIAALVLVQHALDRPAMLLLAGATIFASALYALALGAPRWFGAIAPIGGAMMILGSGPVKYASVTR